MSEKEEIYEIEFIYPLEEMKEAIDLYGKELQLSLDNLSEAGFSVDFEEIPAEVADAIAEAEAEATAEIIGEYIAPEFVIPAELILEGMNLL